MSKFKWVLMACVCFGICIFILLHYFQNIANEMKIENEIRKIISDVEDIDEKTTEIESKRRVNSLNNYEPYKVTTNKEIDGILRIKAIDLELPVFTHMNESDLKISCSRVPNTPPPGEGNYCVMGHTTPRHGVIFNRLYELKHGDEILMHINGGEVLEYIVTEKFITKGLDVQIFEQEDNKQMITLLCCSESVKNGRLVIKGKMTKE